MFGYLAERNLEVGELIDERLLLVFKAGIIALKLAYSGVALVVDGLKLFEFLFGLVFLLDGCGDLFFEQVYFAGDEGLLFPEPFDAFLERGKLELIWVFSVFAS